MPFVERRKVGFVHLRRIRESAQKVTDGGPAGVSSLAFGELRMAGDAPMLRGKIRAAKLATEAMVTIPVIFRALMVHSFGSEIGPHHRFSPGLRRENQGRT
jgi:hypothetical protein